MAFSFKHSLPRVRKLTVGRAVIQTPLGNHPDPTAHSYDFKWPVHCSFHGKASEDINRTKARMELKGAYWPIVVD